MNATTVLQQTIPAAGDREVRDTLLGLARRSIAHGLRHGRPLSVPAAAQPPFLAEHRASFVTLTRDGQLRGCIGRLEAVRPLGADVADNAFAAAFRDPRFAPLAPQEFDELRLTVAVLTPPEPLPVRDEAELLARLTPGEHGLILEFGAHGATFLPKVWEQLPEPAEFLAHLKRKAGLPADYWNEAMRFSVYRSIDYTEDGD
jgi:AmmeMemoRadiSam system protein A